MSNIPMPPTITQTELQTAMTAVDPRVLLVPPRLLRRVIRTDRDVGGLFASVPHQNGYTLSRESLLEAAAPAEIGLHFADEAPDPAVLLPQPSPFELDGRPAEVVLCQVWRRLFHAQLHEAYESALAKANKLAVRERVHRIGRSAFDEICAVLRQENALLPPRTDRSAYIEFAAVYWELKYFAPELLERFFPTLPAKSQMESFLQFDIDLDSIFNRTRPKGAAEPQTVYAFRDDNGGSPAQSASPPDCQPNAAIYARRKRRSRRASKLGNQVRAAVASMRAYSAAKPEQQQLELLEARDEIVKLADRLQQALQLSENDHDTLRETLPEMLEEASQNGWPVERRFLYDLQKICLYHEQHIYALHPFRWLFTLGRKPLKEPLPLQRQVLVAKYLHAAMQRTAVLRIGADHRRRLTNVLKSIAHRCEHELRSELRPTFNMTLDEVGLVPDDHPERVARDKLIEEWLDVLIERGQLNMGDLRDGFSRNQMKMADLAGPGELFWGDAFLRLDGILAEKLRGVYRAGEFYLRWLQRFSSLGFGTALGRFLTRYLALPFGGAFVVLFFAHEVSEKVAHAFHYEVENFVTTSAVLLLGIVLLGLFYVRDFRMQLSRGVANIWGWVRWALIGIPGKFFGLPWVYNLLHGWLMLRFYRYVFWPLVIGVFVWAILIIVRKSLPISAGTGFGVFVVAMLVLNSLLWRRMEDQFASWSSHHWMRFRTNILPGLFRWIIDVFRWFLDLINRALYAIDELLRFRQGQGGLALAVKSVVGVVWSVVAYIVRFCIVLLIEPQINPIKHFPVVTVSHKLILPLGFLYLGPALAQYFPNTFDEASGIFWATVFLSGIPGVFGFLVWELKENWKLYAANRPVYLPKVAIGHHGESMVRLLRPGFHSGTIPKLLSKRRRAEQKARNNGDWRTVRKYEESLHHVEESIRRFLERELVQLLNTTSQWQHKVSIGKIDLSFLSVNFDLHRRDSSEAPIRISLEEQSRWLVTRIHQLGWLATLSRGDVQVVQKALAGLYQMAGVNLIRGQMEAVLPADVYSFDVSRKGFIVWRKDIEAEAFYRFHDGAKLKPMVTTGDADQFPVLTKRSFVYSEMRLTWLEWVDIWDVGHGVREIELSHVETGKW